MGVDGVVDVVFQGPVLWLLEESDLVGESTDGVSRYGEGGLTVVVLGVERAEDVEVEQDVLDGSGLFGVG